MLMPSCKDVAILDHHCCVAKDEINSTVNIYFPVKLTQRVNI